jgi:hypothetical protein
MIYISLKNRNKVHTKQSYVNSVPVRLRNEHIEFDSDWRMIGQSALEESRLHAAGVRRNDLVFQLSRDLSNLPVNSRLFRRFSRRRKKIIEEER